MGDPADGTTSGGAPPGDDAATPPPPGEKRATGRLRRWVGPVAGGIGIVLLVIGGLGFLSASNDHSSRDTADSRRHALRAVQVRADAARQRIQQASDVLGTQIDTEAKAANDLTDAQNAINGAFDAAVNQGNNGDTGGAQAAFQAQTGAVAGLDGKVATERQALGQAQQRLRDLQAAEQGQ
jgi:hypothetical protein